LTTVRATQLRVRDLSDGSGTLAGMVKKVLVSIVLTLGLLAPTALASAQPTAEEQAQAASSTSIRGKWRGPVKHADGSSAGIRITVVIWKKDGRLVGREWRNDGACSARLVFKSWRNGWAHFSQVITSGECTPRTIPMRMQRRGERLLVRWYVPTTEERAYMYARRVS